MPNADDPDIDGLKAEIARLKVELAQSRAEIEATYTACAHTIDELRIGSGKVVSALDCALQTVDALIAWMPEGLTLSPEVSGCKERLNHALLAVFGDTRK